MFLAVLKLEFKRACEPLRDYKGQGNWKTINQNEWFLSLKNGSLATWPPKEPRAGGHWQLVVTRPTMGTTVGSRHLHLPKCQRGTCGQTAFWDSMPWAEGARTSSLTRNKTKSTELWVIHRRGHVLTLKWQMNKVSCSLGFHKTLCLKGWIPQGHSHLR